MRTAKLQTVIDAAVLAADPDERRARGTHSLAEDGWVCLIGSTGPALLELNGLAPRRSNPDHQRWLHAVVAIQPSDVFSSAVLPGSGRQPETLARLRRLCRRHRPPWLPAAHCAPRWFFGGITGASGARCGRTSEIRAPSGGLPEQASMPMRHGGSEAMSSSNLARGTFGRTSTALPVASTS
jgi:hypothetical protein